MAGTVQETVPASEADVLQAVEEVSRDQVVHGTYVYEKDKDKKLKGARAATTCAVYGVWPGPGRAFYKVADAVLDPRHFRATNGTGTIAVRYVVQAIDPRTTSLRIDAVFVEDSRRRTDRSDGTVESAEYEAINQIVESIRQKRELAEHPAQTPEEQAATAVGANAHSSPADVKTSPATDEPSVEQLELQAAELRRRVVARVREDGTALRAAPFHRASVVQLVSANTEVLIVVLTPTWYGIETPGGRHGWIRRSQLESLP